MANVRLPKSELREESFDSRARIRAKRAELELDETGGETIDLEFAPYVEMGRFVGESLRVEISSPIEEISA
jgi:hypothetical protein